MTIQSVLSKDPIDSIVSRYQGKGYGELKQEIGQTVFDFLTDLQARYQEVLDKKIVDEVLAQGAQKASRIADKKIQKVYRKIGFNI